MGRDGLGVWALKEFAVKKIRIKRHLPSDVGKSRLIHQFYSPLNSLEGPHRDFRVAGALFMPELDNASCIMQLHIPMCVDMDKVIRQCNILNDCFVLYTCTSFVKCSQMFFAFSLPAVFKVVCIVASYIAARSHRSNTLGPILLPHPCLCQYLLNPTQHCHLGNSVVRLFCNWLIIGTFNLPMVSF